MKEQALVSAEEMLEQAACDSGRLIRWRRTDAY